MGLGFSPKRSVQEQQVAVPTVYTQSNPPLNPKINDEWLDIDDMSYYKFISISGQAPFWFQIK